MDIRTFYDGLADDYHLIYEDWPASVRRQAAALDRVIGERLGGGRRRILDCTCGIGTQALGLAERGHEVVGTDLSSRAVERARREARARDLPVRFGVADVRRLAETLDGSFDVVLSADNSLPHLLTDEDLRAAVRGMLSRLRPGGLLLASTRDYDRLRKERPTGTWPEARRGEDGRRRIVFQVWDWDADGFGYRLEVFLLREDGYRWTVRSHETRYRAVLREELARLVREEGGDDPRWLMPEESGFFQPLLVASR